MDADGMVWVVMVMLKEMATTEEAAMVTLSIASEIAMMVTVNLCLIENIFILLIKIELLRLLVQTGISTKMVSSILRERLIFIISPTLPLNIVIILPNQNLLSHNMMTLQLRKVNSIHLHILPEITKGRKQVMTILIIFNGRVYTALWLPTKLILFTLEDLFPFSLPLNINQ